MYIYNRIMAVDTSMYCYVSENTPKRSKRWLDHFTWLRHLSTSKTQCSSVVPWPHAELHNGPHTTIKTRLHRFSTTSKEKSVHSKKQTDKLWQIFRCYRLLRKEELLLDEIIRTKTQKDKIWILVVKISSFSMNVWFDLVSVIYISLLLYRMKKFKCNYVFAIKKWYSVIMTVKNSCCFLNLLHVIHFSYLICDTSINAWSYKYVCVNQHWGRTNCRIFYWFLRNSKEKRF